MTKKRMVVASGSGDWMSNVIRLVFCAIAIAVTVSVAGCGSSSVSQENRDLRRENLKLADQLESHQQSITQLQGQLDALNSKINSPAPALAGVKKTDLPVVSRIEFGKFTGAFDTTGDGTNDTVRVYLHLLDQRGRFLPAVGKAVLQVVTIETDSPPKQIGHKVYEPKAFTACYVAGLTGTHFTLELAPVKSLQKGASEVTIKVTYTDAVTGATFTKQIASKFK